MMRRGEEYEKDSNKKADEASGCFFLDIFPRRAVAPEVFSKRSWPFTPGPSVF